MAGEDITAELASLLLPQPRYDRRRTSALSYQEDRRLHRKRRKSAESPLFLKPFSCEDIHRQGGYKCFSKEDVMDFTDEPSPRPTLRRLPVRSASVSLLPDAFPHRSTTAVLRDFPLTTFEREPQVLRSISVQGRGTSLMVPGPLPAKEDTRILFPKGSLDMPCHEQIHVELCESPGTEDCPMIRSCSKTECFRTGLSPSWRGQDDLQKNGSKGSTSSFLSSPSASSGYVTFHSDSISSAS